MKTPCNLLNNFINNSLAMKLSNTEAWDSKKQAAVK